MNLKLFVAVIILLSVTACTTEQLTRTAYSSLGASECKEKTGGLSCDLDERTIDERLMNGAPGALSNEKMKQEVNKINRKNDKSASKQ